MRSVFAVAVLWIQFAVVGTAFSQSITDGVVESRTPIDGKIHMVAGVGGAALPLPEGVKPDLGDPFQVLRYHGDSFGIRFPERELVITRTERCTLGMIHHTFEQVYLGVKVFSGVIKVHLSPDGTPRSINGDFFRLPKKLSVTPSVSLDEALVFAEAHLDQHVLVQTSDAELVIVNPGWWGDPFLPAPVLAHHLVVEGSGMLAEHVLIDAASGDLLDHWPAVHSARFREIYDGSGGGLPGSLARSEGSAASGDTDIDEAYDTAGDLYRLLFDGLGRDSLDGSGGTLTATVHWNDPICPNAIWNGNQIALCNGLATDDVIAHEFAHGLTQFTANLIYQNQPGQLNESYSDIFGETVDLWNGNTSAVGTPGGTPWPGGTTGGGQDTPNSARTGCNDGSTRWRMGEQTSLNAIRDLWFPECFNDPPSTTDPLYNQNACGPFDNGGVHIGSGVFNHSYSMLVDGKTYNGQTVSPIGLTKAAAVYFRALTVYMTSGTAFPQAETFINQAATDLLNSSPNDPRTGSPGTLFTQSDADQVAAAMIAVGMSELVCGQAPPGPPPANDDCSGSVPVFVGLNDINSNNATTGGPPGDSGQCSGTFLGDVGNDIWYSYVPPEDGLLSVSTCDIASWDTDLLVYEGDCGSLLQIACNGDTGGCGNFTSVINDIPVSGGLTYQIRVASWSDGTTGSGQMDVAFVGGGGGAVENCTNGVDDDGDGLIDCEDPDCATDPACIPAAPGDECASASVAVFGSNPVDTTTATQSADPFGSNTCPGTALGQMTSDIWFSFTPVESGDYTISTCDSINFDSDLVVYSGNCGSLIQVACNGDAAGCAGFTSLVEMTMTAGTEYFIRLGGWNDVASGTGTLEIGATTPPPPPENCSNGTDDDLDGLTDCEDPDCIGDPACVCEPISGLVCGQGAGTEVILSWVNGEAYTLISVYRDGVVIDSVPGTATGYVDSSTLPGVYSYTVVAFCDATQQASGVICAVNVELSGGFSLVAADVVGGYSGSGAEFETMISATEFTDNPGFPTNTAGFSFGLGHDPDLFAAIGAAPAGPVAALDGGAGPQFFEASSFPDGITVGCVYSFSFAETIQMITETSLLTINYESLPGVFSSTTGTVTSALEFTETLGNPVVQLIISTDTGVAIGVIPTGAVVTLTPSGFILTAVDQTVAFPPSTGVATVMASFTLAEDATNAGYPNDTQGFSFGVSHDPSVLTVTGAAGAQVIDDLNNGTGADFLNVGLFADGFTCGCVYSFLGIQTIQFDSAIELAIASYDTVPGALIGSTSDVTTTLSISNGLGSPPVQIVVVVNSQALGATGVAGIITLTPVVGGFVRADVNDDALINLADAITVLDALFLGVVINCMDAADTNDDELANIADGVYLLAYLFSGGSAPPAPFGGGCGADPAGTALDCAEYLSCN
jgi:Zn-dependent metalloprotease